MLSMCTRWFYRRLYKRHREALHASFHNNGNNLYNRLLSGLELLTQPNSYGSDDYIELTIQGKFIRSTPTFLLLMERLNFIIKDYDLMLTGCDPRQIPEHLKKEKHPNIPRWIDLYFNTSDVNAVRKHFENVYALLKPYEDAYSQQTSVENNVLWNRTQHILRELEMIVEHYL